MTASVIAGVLVALCVMLAWPRGTAPLRGRRPWRLPGPLRPRKGALGERRRALLGAATGLAWLSAFGASGTVPLVAAVIAGAVFVGLGWLVPASVRERQERLRAQVPETARLLALCLAAGLPMRAATRAVREVSEEPMRATLARVHTLVDVGSDEPAAWEALLDDPAVADLARDVARTVSSGVGLADVLQRRAADVGRELSAVAQARARRVSVSSVLPLMVCYLPAFLLLGVVPIIGGVIGRWFG